MTSVGTVSLGPRARNRAARREQFLDAALDIAATDGLDALTMSRLAAATGLSIGAVYRYFDSKGALLAQVQRCAIGSLEESYLTVAERIDAGLASVFDTPVAALGAVVFFGRFFCAAAVTHPHELRLLQLLMMNGQQSMSLEDALTVLPQAVSMLERAQERIAYAVELGALTPGDTFDRTVRWAASLGGVLQVSTLGRLDATRFDGLRLAREHNAELMVGWGASRSVVAALDEWMTAYATEAELAPRVATDV